MLTKALLALAVVLFSATAFVWQPAEVKSKPATLTYKTVAGAELKVHIWYPAGWNSRQHRPALVLYHGGGWVAGSWQDFQEVAEYFASRGMVTLSVEYRTEGPVAATEDAIDAMNFIFDHAGDLGVDARRIAAAGGSAGGHLALATALLDLPHSDPAKRPAAMVLLNPVTNTTASYPDGWGRGQFENDEQAARYSPYGHLDRDAPPTLIMHGTGDTTVSYRNSADFADKMTRLGNRVSLISYEGQTHGFFNYRADNIYYYETTRQIDKFLQSLGYISGHQQIMPEPEQLVANRGFERGRAHWSSSKGAHVRLVADPSHGGARAALLEGRSHRLDSVTQDVTRVLRRHGEGEYVLGAWLAATTQRAASGTVIVTLKGTKGSSVRRFRLPSARIVPGRYIRLAGTRTISWAGALQSARLRVRPDDATSSVYVDDVSMEFLPSQIGW